MRLQRFDNEGNHVWWWHAGPGYWLVRLCCCEMLFRDGEYEPLSWTIPARPFWKRWIATKFRDTLQSLRAKP